MQNTGLRLESTGVRTFSDARKGLTLIISLSYKIWLQVANKLLAALRNKGINLPQCKHPTKYGKAIGEYSFAAFDELVKDKGMFGEFAPYDFK